MTYDDHYSNENINARAVARQRVDFDDLQNEMAGRETGKISRFLSDEERKRRGGQETSAQRVAQTQLQIMLMQPEYAQAYQGAVYALNNAEDAVYDALVESADNVNDAQKALQEAEKHGASEDELKRLQQQYKETQERHETMLVRDAELEAIRRRIENPNNPLSPEELAKLAKRANDIEAEAKTINEQPAQEMAANSQFNVQEPHQTPNTNPALDLTGYASP